MKRSGALLRFLVPMIAALILAVPAFPTRAQQQQEEITSATPSIVEGLRENALKNRVQAEESLARANQWREMAARARYYATQTKDKKFIDAWLKDAEQDEGNAVELDNQAKRLAKLAGDAEARANRLDQAYAAKNAPPTPVPATQSKPNNDKKDDGALALEDVLGFWESTKGPNFAMAILSVAGPGKPPTPELVIHTNKRKWKGTYTGAASGPIVKLSYTPKANEINPDIPQWAREVLDGKLVWRIELEASGEEIDPVLVGKWYAGEIKWDPDSRDPQSVEITGDGKPWEFELEPNYAIKIDALSRPMLGVRLKSDQDYDADAHPIEALTKGQLFSPYVTLPAEMAKKQGQSPIAVSVKGLTGGARETVELKPRGRIGLRPVTYTTDQPIMIAECSAMGQARHNPPAGSFHWLRRAIAGDRARSGDSVFWTFIAGDDPGPCLDMRVANGEMVEIRAGDAFIEFPLYNSWVQHGLARHEVMLRRLKVGFTAVTTGSYGSAPKEAAAKRLRMLDNYKAIVASDLLTDLHRFYVGELYFGDTAGPAIVLKSDFQFDEYSDDEIHRRQRSQQDPTLLNPLMKAFLEGLTGQDLSPRSGQAAKSIAWTSLREKMLVEEKLIDTSDQIAANAVQTWVEQFAFGGYDGFVTATRGNQLWLVATGTDHHGVRQSGWDRFFAAVGLASDAILTFAGLNPEQAFAKTSTTSRLGKGVEAEGTLFGRASRGVEELEAGATIRSLPRSLSAAEREQLMLRSVPDIAEAEEPIRGVMRSKGEPRASTLMEVHGAPAGGFDPFADLAEKWRIQEYIDMTWGPEAKFVGEWTDEPLMPLQRYNRPECNGMAANRLLFTKGGIKVSNTELHAQLLKIYNDQLAEFSSPAGAVKQGSVVRRGKRTLESIALAPGFLEGYDNLAVRDFLRSHGATVFEIDSKLNVKLKLRHIWSALEKGYGVKIGVDFTKRAGSTLTQYMHARHSVVVEGMTIGMKNGRPAVNAVRVYDSNIGRLIDIPAKIFDQILARDFHSGIMTLVKFEARGA